jgi:hypothetical protein
MSTRWLPLPHFRQRATRELMDKNTQALLHVQSSLLMALCATHPDPLALEQSFDFHLKQSEAATARSPEVLGMISAWARTFRLRMERLEESSPEPGPVTPPTPAD